MVLLPELVESRWYYYLLHNQRRAQQLHQQILSLQKENERMALHDKRLRNDRDTIEYEAREQMHYTRPGEVIYTLPETPGAAQGPGKSATTPLK